VELYDVSPQFSVGIMVTERERNREEKASEIELGNREWDACQEVCLRIFRLVTSTDAKLRRLVLRFALSVCVNKNDDESH